MKSKYFIWKTPLNHLVVHASQHIISERGSERFQEIVDFVIGGWSAAGWIIISDLHISDDS